MKRRLKNEIEDILNVTLFKAYHEFYGHAISEHCDVSDRDMMEKLKQLKKDDDSIIVSSRFFSIEHMQSLIYRTLMKRQDDILSWYENRSYVPHEVIVDFEEACGEGYCYHTDYRVKHQLHRIRVVLVDGKCRGRIFLIKTAFPCASYDDTDVLYDAMDDYRAANPLKTPR